MNNDTRLKMIRVGSLAPGDVHERCTDCEIHHEAVRANKDDAYVLLKGSQEAILYAAQMLFESVKIVPFDHNSCEDAKEINELHEAIRKLTTENCKLKNDLDGSLKLRDALNAELMKKDKYIESYANGKNIKINKEKCALEKENAELKAELATLKTPGVGV